MLLTGPLAGFSNGSINTTVNLPDTVSLGLRQRVTPQLTLLGTAEWTNWSRIGTVQHSARLRGRLLSSAGTPVTIPFQYKDGWFFALGGEYQWSDRLTLRAGAAYEISPITDQVRTPLVPDNNRIWALDRRQLAGVQRLLVRSRLLAYLGAGSVDQHYGCVRQSVV